MTNAEKKRLKKNILHAIIGSILIGISGIYLYQHPAETQSIRSGFGTLFEKITIKREKLTQNESSAELLEKKYKLERYIDGVITSVQDKTCVDKETYKEIQHLKTKLQNIEIEKLPKQWENLIKKIYELDHTIKNECK